MQTFASRMIASLRKKDKGRYSMQKDVAGFEAIPIDDSYLPISLCAKLSDASASSIVILYCLSADIIIDVGHGGIDSGTMRWKI